MFMRCFGNQQPPAERQTTRDPGSTTAEAPRPQGRLGASAELGVVWRRRPWVPAGDAPRRRIEPVFSVAAWRRLTAGKKPPRQPRFGPYSRQASDRILVATDLSPRKKNEGPCSPGQGPSSEAARTRQRVSFALPGDPQPLETYRVRIAITLACLPCAYRAVLYSLPSA